MERDKVFKRWSLQTMGHKHGNQKLARAMKHEREDTTLDKLWGLVPQYTGKTIRRRAIANA
jgi:hypothetical protein